MQVYYVPRVAAIVMLAPLAAAGYFAIHLARADALFHERTPQSTARALDMEPRNTEYLAMRALQVDYDGDDSTALLERAAEISPMSSAPKLRLGLAAEIRGDDAKAEKWLLEAVRIDRQFEPRWTLANFYFRRGDREHFFATIRDALEVSYGDRRPAFELCWRMSVNPKEIADHAIPERHEVLAAYVAYTIEQHRDAVADAALKLAQFRDVADQPLLFAASDALIEPDPAASQSLWTALGFPAPAGVSNGDFSHEPTGHGFDWRPAKLDGIEHIAIRQPKPAWRILLSGREPESCVLLTQVLAVEPGRSYEIRWTMDTTGFSKPSGLEWSIGNAHAPVEWGSMKFDAIARTETLALAYHRPLGQARAEGSVQITNVSMVR